MDPTLTYFAQHGPVSDPGAFASLYNNLPTSIAELVKLVQGITIHVFWTESYGFKAPLNRMDELQLRTMEKRLGRTMELDAAPSGYTGAGTLWLWRVLHAGSFRRPLGDRVLEL